MRVPSLVRPSRDLDVMNSAARRTGQWAQRTLDVAMARDLGLIAIFAVLSGLARVGQDAAITWRFGAGAVADAYYFLLNLANWPAAVMLSVLTVLLGPTAVALRDRAAGSARRFRAELLGAVALLALFSIPLTWWALSSLAGGNVGGLRPEAAGLARAGVPAFVAVVPLALLGAVLSAWFVATGRHVLTLLEALPSLVLISLLLLVPGEVLFWGTAAGIATQVAVLALVLRRAGELPGPRLGVSAPAWSPFLQGAVVLLLSQMMVGLFPLVDALLAARLGEGALASVSLASRLVLGLQGVVGLALQRAGLPLLSRLVAHSPGSSREAAMRWALMAALLGAAAGLCVSFLANPLVALLYQRGRFTAADTEQVARLLRYGMLQMPPFLASMALVTALASAAARRGLASVAPVGFAAKVVFSLLLVRSFGPAGLMLATALMYCVTAGMTWLVLKRRFQAAPADAMESAP